MASKAATGEAPPERRTIHVIFADPILVAGRGGLLGRPSLAKLLFVEFCGLVFGTAAVFLCRSGIRICFEILLGFY